MVFFTDLDKTIVYSRESNHVCVEYKGDEEITYMTLNAKNLLNKLLCKENITIIPCTLRSFEQTSRIEFISNTLTPFLICDNGFSIYNKGNLDESWDSYMQSQLKAYPNNETFDTINQFVKDNNIPIRQIKSNRNAFFTIIFQCKSDAELYANKVIEQVDPTLYKFELQGRKLYIIPLFLDKVLALNYLKREFSHDVILTAGDSKVDENFIKEGDIMILPNHSELNIMGARRTNSIGINAGEEILEIVHSEYRKDLINNQTL